MLCSVQSHLSDRRAGACALQARQRRRHHGASTINGEELRVFNSAQKQLGPIPSYTYGPHSLMHDIGSRLGRSRDSSLPSVIADRIREERTVHRVYRITYIVCLRETYVLHTYSLQTGL